MEGLSARELPHRPGHPHLHPHCCTKLRASGAVLIPSARENDRADIALCFDDCRRSDALCQARLLRFDRARLAASAAVAGAGKRRRRNSRWSRFAASIDAGLGRAGTHGAVRRRVSGQRQSGAAPYPGERPDGTAAAVVGPTVVAAGVYRVGLVVLTPSGG